MKVLVVFAHPEPQSLTGHFKDVTVQELKSQGHEVKITDLYAHNWKAKIGLTLELPKGVSTLKHSIKALS